MGALVTVMVSPHLADGCAVAKDAVAALVADGWTPPAHLPSTPAESAAGRLPAPQPSQRATLELMAARPLVRREGPTMSLEQDIARAARELREERRIERQEWRKIHRFVREHEKRRPLIHNGDKARK